MAFDPSTGNRTRLSFGVDKEGSLTIDLADGRRIEGTR
jgi:hypothetical protein